MGPALTAAQVGQLVTFVAAGFVARAAYRLRLPDKERSPFTILVSCVVLSFPLVAVTRAIARPVGIDVDNVLALPFVALLLGLSMLAGYCSSLLRTARPTRRLLLRLGLAMQPEASIYSMMLQLPGEATVTVEFLDGRKLSGTPKAGPSTAGDGVDELLITHPAWWDQNSRDWLEEVERAVIVPLAQVHSVTLDRVPD